MIKNIFKEKDSMYTDIHKEANRMAAGAVCLFGNTGAGKSLYFGWLATKQMQKIIFLTKSWSQAEEKAEFFSSLGLDTQLAKSKSQYAKEAGLDTSAFHTKKSCPFAVPVAVNSLDSAEKEMYDSLTRDNIDFSKQVIVTVFANINSLRGAELGEWTVVFDDPEYSDIKTLIKYEPKQWHIRPELEWAKIRGKDIAFAQRPDEMRINYEILAGKVYFTTAEYHVRKILESKYFAHTVDIGHKETDHNIAVVSTEMTRKKKQDGLISVWYSAYKLKHKDIDWTLIGDGIGADITFTSMKGKNSLQEENILVELSHENQVVLEEMYCLLAPNKMTDNKSEAMKVMNQLHRIILIDKFHQVVGRNQGNRATGKFTVVLIDKVFANSVVDMCNFSDVPVFKDIDFRSKALITRRFGRQDFLLELGAFLYNKAEYIYQQKYYFERVLKAGIKLKDKQLIDMFKSLFDEQAKLAAGRSDGIHFEIANCLFQLVDI